MPVVELSYARLQRLIGRASKRQISAVLPFLGLDIESEDGDLVRVEYSPNRPDYSTDFGVALGLQGLLGVKIGAVRLRVKKSERYSISARPEISMVRPFVTCIAATNGKIDDKTIKQLISLQEDLHFGIGRKRTKSSIGIHDLDKIAFPLIYETAGMDHRFVPLHSGESLSISEILKNTDTGRDYGHILDNSTQLPVISDAENNTVSFPPIINATTTTVTTKTKNLLVEVTGTSKSGVEDVLSVVAVILQSAGFALESVRVSGAGNSTPKLRPRKMSASIAMINQMLGLDLSASKIVSSLKKSRLDASASGKNVVCNIPAYRFDIFGPMDLVEEVALGYGIQNLEPVLSPSQTVGQKHPNSVLLESVSAVMTGLGFTEALNSSLTSKRILYDSTNRDSSKSIPVLDSKSLEHTILRDSLLPGMIDSLAKNIHESYPQKLFEIGTVFDMASPVSEETRLCAVSSHKRANFSEIKSVLQSAVEAVFGKACKTRTAKLPTFENGHAADIILDGRVMGFIGQISKPVMDIFKLREPVVAFELKMPD